MAIGEMGKHIRIEIAPSHIDDEKPSEVGHIIWKVQKVNVKNECAEKKCRLRELT
jgi:hypothetical protein